VCVCVCVRHRKKETKQNKSEQINPTVTRFDYTVVQWYSGTVQYSTVQYNSTIVQYNNSNKYNKKRTT
jgi:hypothetical protein